MCFICTWKIFVEFCAGCWRIAFVRRGKNTTCHRPRAHYCHSNWPHTRTAVSDLDMRRITCLARLQIFSQHGAHVDSELFLNRCCGQERKEPKLENKLAFLVGIVLYTYYILSENWFLTYLIFKSCK